MKLAELFITEISAVDDPANAAPGWMIRKALEPATEESSLVFKSTAEGIFVIDCEGGNVDAYLPGEALPRAVVKNGESVEVEKANPAQPRHGQTARYRPHIRGVEKTVKGLVNWMPGGRYSRIW